MLGRILRQHGERGWTLILLPGESQAGWTTVCIKTRKRNKNQLILLSRWKKKKNQTNPIFLSDCKSVYKCTACGCVRGCVIGNVYQHLNYCREIFRLRALLKAHVSWMDSSSLWDSFTVEPGLLHHLLDTLTHFPERPFPVKSHQCPGQIVRGFFVCTRYPQQVISKNTFIILLIF